MNPTSGPLLLLLTLLIDLVDSNSVSNSKYIKFLQDQDRLVTDLLANYSLIQSPIYTLADRGNGSDAIPKFTVNLVSSQLKLIEISDPEELATFLFDFTASWIDPRLTWNPDDYGGIELLYLPVSKVWVPEMTVVDCTKSKTFMPDNMRNVWITPNGNVSFYEIELISVICEMDVFRFPMDQQTCSVNVIYYSYTSAQYQINATFGQLVRDVEESGNGEWVMKSLQIGSFSVIDNSSVVYQFQATMKRNPGFYVVLVIIPAYFINALSIIALFCNTGSLKEKFEIGLTNIMSMSFIMVILSNDLPKTRNIPLLAIYVLISLAIMLGAMGTVLLIPKIKLRFGFFEKLRRFKIEYIIVVIFQLANFINFIVLFL